VGFSYRWLVSLTRGKDIRERACKAVGYWKSVVESPGLKSYRISRFASIPPVYSLRRICAYDEFAEYRNQSRANLGRQLRDAVSLGERFPTF
jgi:hypothetical protein